MTKLSSMLVAMVISILVGLSAVPALAAAQGTTLSASDSALIGRILLAEDRRDSTDQALGDGLRHADARVRTFARRALGRIRDPRFVTRDSFPSLPAPTAWPEPAWRLRYRALATQREDCGALRTALGDSAWPVRFRAMALLTPQCGSDDVIVMTIRRWIDALPTNTSRRTRGNVSWHAAAHGIVALARIRPNDARDRVRRLTEHRQWEVRMYAARAAELLSDTATLRQLADDVSDNVKEASIEGLAKLVGHAADSVYRDALYARGAQVVRAAAIALKGSTQPDLPAVASRVFEQWVARANQSERDVRVALLEAAGRPATDDRPPVTRVELPPRAVALALGDDVRLRVTMSPSTGGGGSFVVRLRGDVAPMMAARILALAGRGYYDGLTWHRVEHDFVIQGLSPGANEYIGLAQYLRDELGTVPHVRGTVGMSTRGHDTGDAQWFINLTGNLRLNRDFTVFAEVVEGMDVVDAVMEGDVVERVRAVSRSPLPTPARSPRNRPHRDYGTRG